MLLAPQLAIALGLGVTSAPATERYDLSWTAPASCPDEAFVRADLDRRLAESPPSDDPPVRAVARVTRRQGGDHELLLTFGPDGADGRRTIVDPSCDELAAAAVVIVAIAVDPSVLEREPTPVPPANPTPTGEPSPSTDVETADASSGGASPDAPPSDDEPGPGPEPEPEVPSPAAPPASETAEPAPPPLAAEPPERAVPTRGEYVRGRDPTRRPPRARGPLLASIGLFAGAAIDVLPRAVADLELSGSLGGRAWRAELAVAYLTPADASASANPEVGGRFQVWSVTPRGCGVPPTGPVELQLCAGARLGAIHARGTGALSPNRPVALFAAAELSAGLGWRPAAMRRRVGVFVRGAVLPALTRTSFGTDESGLVYRTPAVGGRVGAFVEVRFAVTDRDGGGL